MQPRQANSLFRSSLMKIQSSAITASFVAMVLIARLHVELARTLLEQSASLDPRNPSGTSGKVSGCQPLSHHVETAMRRSAGKRARDTAARIPTAKQ